MLNISDIMETVRMIQNDNLDIRTTTMGISLLDCCDTDIDRSCDKVYDKICRLAGDLVKTGEDISKLYGIPIINKRVAVTPISMLLASSGGDPVKYAKALDRAAHTIGVNFIGGYSALVHKGFAAGDRELINSIPEALSETELICSSVNIGTTKAGINMDAVAMMGDLRGAYLDLGKKAVSEIKNITNPSGPAVSRKFYPMDRKELAKRINDILGTKPSRGADKNQQDAVNVANVYRLLCGVPANMSYDSSYAKDAQQAAEACLKAGTIDHGLGHHTDECNLHMGPAGLSSADSVREYIEDPGQNNYEQRGHRAWILYPKSVKTGFGVKGGFHAMRTSDLSGSPLAAAHSYPGRGFFPKEYLLGDGWSYYPAQGQSVGSNATVRIWRLSRSPKSAPSAKELASAKEIKITKVCVHPDNGMFPVGNSIVFMPDYSQMPSKNGKPSGVYWVSIVSGSVHDEYVVDLF